MSPLKYTYAVIGAGIEGSSAAYYLAKNGFKTVLLEQFRLGHSRGSSHGCSRITRKCYDHSDYVEMMKRAYDLWAELERESGANLFKKTGLLYVGTIAPPPKGNSESTTATDRRHVNNFAETMSKNGLPHVMLSHEEIRRKFPNLKYDAQWRGLFDPEAGLLKADACLRSFQDQFKKHGGEIRDDDAIIGVDVGAGVKIRAASGAEYHCDGLIVCAGTWAAAFLNDFLGLKLPLQPAVVKACYWKVQKKDGSYSTANNFPCILTNSEHEEGSEFYGLPSDEYPGLFKFCSHEGVPVNSPDERDSVDASEYVRKPARYVREHFDYIHAAQPAIVETCMYTMTPDKHFILDTHPKYKNVAIGAGFSGHGFKFAPVVGEILGSRLLGRPLPFDLNMFRIGRF